MSVHPKVSAATVGAGLGSSVADLIVWWLQLHGTMVPDKVGDAIAMVAGLYEPNPNEPFQGRGVGGPKTRSPGMALAK